MARERPDIIHSLPEQKLALLVKQELPYEERKITNAKARLNASYLDKQSLPLGVGGVASTQDLCRLLIGAYYSIRQARKIEEQVEEAPRLHQAAFLDAVTALIPDVMQLMASAPDPAAIAKADAVAKTKEDMAFLPVRPNAGRGRGRDRESSAGLGRSMSRQDSRTELRPGDWICEVCKQHNFASRQDCYRCNAEKPGWSATMDEEVSMPRRQMTPPPVIGMDQDSGMRPGDWSCPECNNVNFARRMECNRCNMPRPAETIPRGGIAKPAFDDTRYADRRTDFASQGVKQGDWFCPECNAHNFASRRECFKCNVLRPAGAGGGGGGPRAAPPPFEDRRYSNRRTDIAPAGARQGDWFCGDCGAHNFASRTQCFQCESPKASGKSVTVIVKGTVVFSQAVVVISDHAQASEKGLQFARYDLERCESPPQYI
ncbi:hypothetical protein WJX73_006120 [Symbiochloris irregularis]|uniref:RanBP2-type domain-containing protein n=1 Tax=Symbiochloris irregularis TaxID=706552 RepID=A0AAW1NNN1_9CHLO